MKLSQLLLEHQVKIKGKPSKGQISKFVYDKKGNAEFKSLNMITDKELMVLKKLTEKILKTVKAKREYGNFILDFTTDHSGEALRKGRDWEIGLKGFTFAEGLGLIIHEVGHLTQEGRLGGIGREDYANRRVDHEKEAWNNGLKLFNAIGYKLAAEEKAEINQLKNKALSAYHEYFTDREI
jgi:hypothetical protein